MALNGYESHCKPHQKIIVSRDHGNQQTHTANNIDNDEVYQYRIDGEVITEGLRCDFLVWNETKRHIYFIELKGSDVAHALDQIDATEDNLRKRFSSEINSCSEISYRIILNRTKNIKLYSNKEKRFKNKHLGDLRFGTRSYNENI